MQGDDYIQDALRRHRSARHPAVRDNNVPIPRQVHHIWLGDRAIPDQCLSWIESWRRMNPDWGHRLWTDETLGLLAEVMVCPEIVFGRRDLNFGILGDVARYEVLRLFGGVYVDVDFECIRPVDPLLIDGCIHYGEELDGRPAIGFIASPPNHPLWQIALAEVSCRLAGRATVDDLWETIGITGPEAFARWIRSWIGEESTRTLNDESGQPVGWHYQSGRVVALARQIVYPYHYREATWHQFRRENHPTAYAAHHWAGTWQ